MKRVVGNYAALIAISIIGVVVVLLLEHSANTYSPLTVVLAVFTFASVIAAAMMIAWAAEASQFSISQGLALAIVAIVQTLPEFFVEGAIAWNAGQDPNVWLPNVTANFTGANRLLTGLGWPLILFTALVQRRRNGGKKQKQVIALKKEHSIEVIFMLGATLYFIPVWLKGSLELVDTAVLTSTFLAYMWILSRLPSEDEDPEVVLDALPLSIVRMSRGRRLIAILGLFLVSGFVFVMISHPFVESINTIAVALLGVGAGFFFIQLIAPFLSEFPEKVTAFHWARKVSLTPMALLNFVSSAVSELTALVAIIPVVFAVSLGGITPVSILSHRDEVLLTLAQSLYACACLMDLEYDTRNALVLFGLWLVSTVFVQSRFWISIIFLVMTPVELAIQRGKLTAFSSFRETLRPHSAGNSQPS